MALNAESQPHQQLPCDRGWGVCQQTGRSPVLLQWLTQPYEELSQVPLIGVRPWHCTIFGTFGIKDFLREAPLSRSLWLQKIIA